jgi:hypothetical protein
VYYTNSLKETPMAVNNAKSTIVIFRLRNELHAAIKALALADRRPLSQLLTFAVEEYLKAQAPAPVAPKRKK